MEHMKVTDEWLYKYMPIVDAAIIHELESKTDMNYNFSKKFEKKMKRLIRKEAHPWLEIVQSIGKRVAVFLIGIIGVTFLFTMSVEAHREKFFETVKLFWEDSFIFSYFTDTNTNKLISSEPTYVPGGYVEIDRGGNENYLSITYQNQEGELLLWDQMLVTDGGSMTFDLEYDKEERKDIHGSEAIIYIYSNGFKSGYYEYEEYCYMVVTESLSVDEIYQMFESIEIVED